MTPPLLQKLMGKKCFLLFKIHNETFPTEEIGLSAKAMSDLWWGKRVLFFVILRRTVDLVSLLQKYKQKQKKKNKGNKTLYVNDHNDH